LSSRFRIAIAGLASIIRITSAAFGAADGGARKSSMPVKNGGRIDFDRHGGERARARDDDFILVYYSQETGNALSRRDGARKAERPRAISFSFSLVFLDSRENAARKSPEVRCGSAARAILVKRFPAQFVTPTTPRNESRRHGGIASAKVARRNKSAPTWIYLPPRRGTNLWRNH